MYLREFIRHIPEMIENGRIELGARTLNNDIAGTFMG
jgi:hypothetical protein